MLRKTQSRKDTAMAAQLFYIWKILVVKHNNIGEFKGTLRKNIKCRVKRKKVQYKTLFMKCLNQQHFIWCWIGNGM